MKQSFRCLTLLVTNKCPLKCAHCGPQSGPQEMGIIDLKSPISTLDEAKKRNCKVVNFSGGEPFILGNRLIAMVKAASARGFVTRITTGAYWSSTCETAMKRLEPLSNAGLQQLFISSSDAHQRFVPFTHVITATSCAQTLGMEVYLSIGITMTSKSGFQLVRQAFEAEGVDIPHFVLSPVIPFGRAHNNYIPDDLLLQPVEKFMGPCSSLTEHPTIHSDGQVTGCAVIFGRECEALNYGNIYVEQFDKILDQMNANPLAVWIHKIGVVELKRFIEANTSIRFAEQYINICHLCGDILTNKKAIAFLSELGCLNSVR